MGGTDEIVGVSDEVLQTVDGVNIHGSNLIDLGHSINLTFEVSFDEQVAKVELSPQALEAALELAGFNELAASKDWPNFSLNPINYIFEPCGADPVGDHMVISLNMTPGAYTTKAVIDSQAINDPRVVSLVQDLTTDQLRKVFVAIGPYLANDIERDAVFLLSDMDVEGLRTAVAKQGLAVLEITSWGEEEED